MSASDLDTGSLIPTEARAVDTALAEILPALEYSNSLNDVPTPTVKPIVSEVVNKTASGTVCGVCNLQESKYTCVKCSLPFCSVACSTLHRATHPIGGEEATSATPKAENAPANGAPLKPVPGTTSAAGDSNPFAILEKSEELKALFANNPQLRSQLRDIHNATLPPTDDSSNTHGHHEDVNQTHRGSGKGRGGIAIQGRGTWNTDRGTQDGIDALKVQSLQYGQVGEGIREYSELVLKLVALEGEEVAKLVQQEVAEENAKIISQLLNGDAY